MEEMKETYIQEANELLENLESSLLSLEDNPNDKSNIEQIFRVMHTLKGNSSMFGLTKIAEFVHDLETIYDLTKDPKNSKLDGRMYCVFENGTESNLLFRSLGKLLYDNGWLVSTTQE
jgi:two-component system chemotaxis sensor kinase CheA